MELDCPHDCGLSVFILAVIFGSCVVCPNAVENGTANGSEPYDV